MMAQDLKLTTKEMEPKIIALKGLIEDIQKNPAHDKSMVSLNKSSEITQEGKKAKQSVIKSNLATHKNELGNLTNQISSLQKALALISEIREDSFRKCESFKKEVHGEIYREVLLDTLKEVAEALPLWVSDTGEDPPPLCGAIQVEDDYEAKSGDMVAAFITVKSKKLKEWILAKVKEYNPEKDEYKVQDIEEKQNSTYVVKRDKIIPLPVMRADPEHSPEALFERNTTVLALYENTTCFYKGLVHEPPNLSSQPYLIAFEDNECPSGYSDPIPVHQRYVLACRKLKKSMDS